MKWGRTFTSTGIALFSLARAAVAADFETQRAVYDAAIMRPDAATFVSWYDKTVSAPLTTLDPQIAAQLSGVDRGEGPVAPPPNLLDNLTYTPSERNQSGCGNCWVWAGTALLAIENNYKYGVKDRLSVQLLNSCLQAAEHRDACDGGLLTDVAHFYNEHQEPIPWSNSNAQFSDQRGTAGAKVACSAIPKFPQYVLTTPIAITNVPTTFVPQAEAIANIKNVLNQHKGVGFLYWLAKGAHWKAFQNFFGSGAATAIWNPDGGEYCGAAADGGFGGHAVVIVGYNEDDPNPDLHYWTVLNSWGTGWKGNRLNGTFRMKMNMNYDCYVTSGGYAYWSRTFQALDATLTGTSALTMSVKDATTSNINYKTDTGAGWGVWANVSGSTSHRPALAAFNTRQYLAVKVFEANKIRVRSMDYLGTWSSWKEIPGAAVSAPALVVFKNRLHLFRRDLSGALSFKTLGTKGGWSTRWIAVPGSRTIDTPGVAVYGNRLYLAETDSAGHIQITSKGTNGSWGEWVALDGNFHSDAGPTLASYRDKLYLAAKGRPGESVTQDISYTFSSTPGVTGSFAAWSLVGGTTDKSPVLSVGPDPLQLNFGVKGDNSTRLWTRTWDGHGAGAWGSWIRQDGASTDAPAMDMYYTEPKAAAAGGELVQ